MSGPLLDVYPRLPIHLLRAEGRRLIAADGRELLDLYGGHAVTPLGHGHPELTQALCEGHRELERLKQLSHELRDYVVALHRPFGTLGRSPFSALARLASISEPAVTPG